MLFGVLEGGFEVVLKLDDDLIIQGIGTAPVEFASTGYIHDRIFCSLTYFINKGFDFGIAVVEFMQ